MRRAALAVVGFVALPVLAGAAAPTASDAESPGCLEVRGRVTALVQAGEASAMRASRLAEAPHSPSSYQSLVDQSRAQLLPAWQLVTQNPDCFVADQVQEAAAARQHLER